MHPLTKHTGTYFRIPSRSRVVTSVRLGGSSLERNMNPQPNVVVHPERMAFMPETKNEKPQQEKNTVEKRFVLDLRNTELGTRKPKEILEFDRLIRNWTAESARSKTRVG